MPYDLVEIIIIIIIITHFDLHHLTPIPSKAPAEDF
jgi:hypothetical protein